MIQTRAQPGGPLRSLESEGAAGSPDHGEVFTRRWIVELILDLAGYTADRDLAGMRLVEPSCGNGAFLRPVVDRLVRSCRRHGRPLTSLAASVRAFDLLEDNAAQAREAVADHLRSAGLDPTTAHDIAREWIRTGDFLLQPHAPGEADFVVGNPPYVRLESVHSDRMNAYRNRWPTMRGRSDLYVGFVERGLDLLREGGRLAYICADRWMRNQYGAQLRELVSTSYAVEVVVSMHDVDAFEGDVAAYPAIVVIRNGRQESAVVADATASFDPADADALSSWTRDGERSRLSLAGVTASRLPGWFEGRSFWPSGPPEDLSLLADLEARFPPLEDPRTGTRVGVGIATGCDDVFITEDDRHIEAGRLLPLLQAADTASGVVRWSGKYLVNPWGRDGLVDLDRYPRLREYLLRNEDRLRARHIARKRPANWYRTIDRVDAGLIDRPKLLLPDLKASSHPVLAPGGQYPHHNLYWVVSDKWDLEVLGGLLLSEVANLFVGAYCVKMRGGCYRFQAQYIRRIRVPEPGSLSRRVRADLAAAFRARDASAATAAATRAYGLPRDALIPHPEEEVFRP